MSTSFLSQCACVDIMLLYVITVFDDEFFLFYFSSRFSNMWQDEQLWNNTFSGLRDEKTMDTVVDSTVSDQVSVGQLRQQRQRDSRFQHLIRVTTQFGHQIAEPSRQPTTITGRVVCCLPKLVHLTHQPSSSTPLTSTNNSQTNRPKTCYYLLDLIIFFFSGSCWLTETT